MHTAAWLPQRQLLLQPRTLAFITHGGMNSLVEASWAGVPMLQVPLFGDQLRNAQNAHKRGIALLLEKPDLLDKARLVSAIEELIEDPR